MLLLDVLFRYPTVTLLLVFAVLAVRDGRNNVTSLLGALTTISVAALLLGTSHPDLTLPLIPRFVVRMFDVPSVVLVWWFGRSLFEDDFHLGKVEWLGMLMIVVPVFVFRLYEFGLVAGVEDFTKSVEVIVSGISVLMMLHLMYTTITGRADDVIESRRRLRFYFVVGLVATTILVVVGERIFIQEHPIEMNTFRAIATLPIVLFASLWLIKYHPETLSFQEIETVRSAPKIDPRDTQLHENLLSLMEHENVYTEPGLTIGLLAEKLQTQEHHLRSLINKGMDYRNFSSFVNHYRIIAIKKAMELPENARTPILTLALNQGFNSLAPFNKAFRSITGQTPTAYRSSLINKT